MTHHPGIGKAAGAEWNQREGERSEILVPLVEGAPVWEFPDTEAEAYKDKLEESLQRDRASRYAHLNDRRFEKVVELVRRRSRTIQIRSSGLRDISGRTRLAGKRNRGGEQKR